MIKINQKGRHLLDSKYIYQYIHGGRGIVTLEAPTGKSHTYAFFRPLDPSEFPDDILFVYAVHNGCKLFYIGMIEQDVFRITKHSRFLNDNEIVKGARYIVKMSLDSRLVDNTPMKLYHEGICCRCGRKLNSDNSKISGTGPKCNKIMHDNGKP